MSPNVISIRKTREAQILTTISETGESFILKILDYQIKENKMYGKVPHLLLIFDDYISNSD
jgi:hypothetical protein